jgi:Fe-S-cluster containining protein
MGEAGRMASNGTSNGSGHGTGRAELALAALAELDRQLERGSFFNQAVFQRGFSRLEQVETLLARLVDVLSAQGVVAPDELGFVTSESMNGESAPSLEEGGEVPAAEAGEAGIVWPSVALRVDDPDEPLRAGVEVDCGSRMHICRAVCCRLKFPLSCEEVDSGTVKWDIGHPYVIRHESSGYCTHNDTGTGCCRIYGDRPAVCRRYSCAGDTRIWTDFEGMILNQAWIDEHLGARDLHVAAVVPSMEERLS